MTVSIQRAVDGARGIDTVATLSAASCESLRGNGVSFVVRYLGGLSGSERDAILASGLGLMLVAYAHKPGWQPNAALGATDGAHQVQLARALGVPAGATLWCDVEGPAKQATADDTIGYVNAWSAAAVAAGYEAGIYVGYGVPLTSDQLFHELTLKRYWHSCSDVPDVAVRGYQMRQLTPPNQQVAGIEIDWDVVEADRIGDLPTWLIDLDAANA